MLIICIHLYTLILALLSSWELFRNHTHHTSFNASCAKCAWPPMPAKLFPSPWPTSSRSLIRIRWWPNWVFTQPWTLPTSSLNTTLSNGSTIWPGPKVPKSPPRFPEGQRECVFAMSAKSSPAAIFVFRSSHSPFVFTRMWCACAWRWFVLKWSPWTIETRAKAVMAINKARRSILISGYVARDDTKG